MIICQNCGSQLEDGTKFCTNCGNVLQNEAATPEPAFAAAPQAETMPQATATAVMDPVASAPEPVAQPSAPQPETYQQPMPPQDGYQQPAPQPGAAYQQPAPPQGGYQQPMPGYAAAPQMKKGMAVLSYFGFFVLIPLFAAKNDPFARYHTNQGLVLFLCSVICSVLSNFLSNLLLNISAVIALVVSLLFDVISIALCVFAIIGIIHAAKGQQKPLPLIGGIRLLK